MVVIDSSTADVTRRLTTLYNYIPDDSKVEYPVFRSGVSFIVGGKLHRWGLLDSRPEVAAVCLNLSTCGLKDGLREL